jgi:ribonuclease HI
MSADPQLPAPVPVAPAALRRVVWSDGSCVHPLDPLMARSAWGLRVDANGDEGRAFDLAGPVDGPQTAQRAEVTAALAAVQSVAEPVELVSDSRWVVNSVAALIAGACPAEWRHADLWEKIVPHVQSGKLRARWTPAHQSAEEYLERGLAERDRLGNAAADANAGVAAAARLPPDAIVAARKRQVDQLWNVQRLLALTELAALSANHRRIGNAQPRVRRRWADIRRGARAATRRAASAPQASSQPAACRAVAPLLTAGPPPPSMHTMTRDGDTLLCRLCGKTAVRARWSALAYGCCSANGGGAGAAEVAGVSWQRVPHRIEEADGFVRCSRCHGSVPSHRRDTFVGRRCPAWWAAAPAADDAAAPGGDQPGAALDPPALAVAPAAGGGDWGAWVFAMLGHHAAGTSAATARSARPRGDAAAPLRPAPVAEPDCTRAAVQALLSGTAWRPHAAARGPRLAACMQCGASAASWPLLAATPCRGWAATLPPRVAALALVGGELQCAGGSPEALADAVRRRMEELPAGPD